LKQIRSNIAKSFFQRTSVFYRLQVAANEKLLAAVRLSYLKSTKVSTRTEAFK